MTPAGNRNTPDPARVYRRLRRWFLLNQRPMPWRGDTDPYRVWISEIMLVQTTVAVVLKRYPLFLKRFPTMKALAVAPLSRVMKAWEGMGYYNRARYLHQTARIIRDEYGGRFPSRYDDIRALSGIGDYVAAAVANFCFGTRLPPVDANVARLAARFFAIKGDVRSGLVRRRITEELTGLMTRGQGALWTDALIELGAVLCTPRAPQCDVCPLQRDCRGFRTRQPASYGLPAKKPPVPEVTVACGVILRADGRILIAQRREEGLLPGLWEFPGGKRQGNERLATTCSREIAEELAVCVTVGKQMMMIRHAYSHYRVKLHVFLCRYQSGRPRAIACQRFRWVRRRELARYAFPSADRRIIADLIATAPA